MLYLHLHLHPKPEPLRKASLGMHNEGLSSPLQSPPHPGRGSTLAWGHLLAPQCSLGALPPPQGTAPKGVGQ